MLYRHLNATEISPKLLANCAKQAQAVCNSIYDHFLSRVRVLTCGYISIVHAMLNFTLQLFKKKGLDL